MKRVLIVGCGDIGLRVAHRLINHGVDVHAWVRSEASAQTLQLYGIKSRSLDLATRPISSIECDFDTLFYFVAPPKNGVTDEHFVGFLRAYAFERPPQRLILLSTTAVYGDCQGEWIDESCNPNPGNERGQRRLHAELSARKWCEQNRVCLQILRVGGIYGPQRLPLARIDQGVPIVMESQSPYTNRIHQDDLAKVCVAAAVKARKDCDVFNVCDGHPGTMSQYFKDVARCMGRPQPPEVDLQQARHQFSAGMLSYLSESRRIRNDKLLRELGVTLDYPDLATGLAQCQSELQS